MERRKRRRSRNSDVDGQAFDVVLWNEQGTLGNAMTIDGALDYIELPAANIVETKRFYGHVFGWSFTDYGPDYVASEVDGRSGFLNASRQPVSQYGQLVVVYANGSLDAMEARVSGGGGRPSFPRESFEGGRRFHFHAIPTAARSPSGRRAE